MPSKLEAVVRRVKRLIRNPLAKVLVFSTWVEVLDVLSHALAENDIRYAFARTPKQLVPAIEQLRTAGISRPGTEQPGPKPLQTLLLPVKQGGNGLNLTEAQHVILIEPLVSPGVEAQVVGRVHRIGQTKKTFVHSFVIQDTVEENVYRLNRERAANVDVANMAGSSKAAAKEDQSFTIRDIALLLKKPWEDIEAPRGGSALPIPLDIS